MDHPFLELLSGDKRKVKRVNLRKPVKTTLNIMGQKIVVELYNYSHHGMGLIVPGEKGIQLVESQLVFPEMTFEGQLVHQQITHSKGIQVGFALPQNQGQKYLFRFDDPDWDIIKDEKTIENIYDDVVFKGYECPIEIYQHNNVMSFFPLKKTTSGTMIGEIHETKQGQVQTGEGFCNFLLFQTYHVFQTEVLKRDDKQVEVKLSPTINRLLRRETLRIESQEREYELKVTLDCKLLNQSFTDDQVLDYSEHGISLMDIDQKYAFPKGMPIEEIAIEVKGKPAIKGHGRVRNYVWNSDKKTYVVGIHFEANGEPHLTNWHNFILKARYPMLEFNYCPDEYQKIWDLFERSKYLGLKPRESFDYVYDFSKKTWENMSKAGSYFSKRILLKKDGSIVGHLQFDRLYPKTWCVHALAIDPTAQKMLGKEIYSVTSDLLLFQGDAYIISITETELTWNEKNYYKFVETYPTEGHNQIKVFQIHEAEIEKGWDLNTSSQYNIRLANKYDLAMIANYIELNFDPIEITALSLDKDNLELDEFNSACEKHGLTRYRKFLVALKNGKIKGFSILETGSTGLSIFGIQDTMYIYIVDDIPEKQRLELHDSLLNDSLLFYKGLNIPTVNIYMEKPMREYYSDKNIKFVWEGSRWIAKAEASKKYHAFTQNLYGHLLLKREIIRKKAKKSEK